MIEVPQLFISEEELGYRDEVERLKLITDAIQTVDIDPFTLVYCGIEGQPILNEGRLPVLYQTFGMSYMKFRERAEEKDKYGSAVEQNPLEYALASDHVPAMVTYEETMLTEDLAVDIWRPRGGSTLEEAVRTV